MSPAPSIRECKICLEESCELLALLPCAHRAACAACSERLLKEKLPCPICRTQASGWLEGHAGAHAGKCSQRQLWVRIRSQTTK